MKNIVIFGATGDTGRCFVEYFKQHYAGDQYQIVAVGTRKTSYFDQIDVPYYQVDITKKEELKKLPGDVYAVLDLAGVMPARMEGYDPYKYVDVNIIGTLNVLEYCREQRADRILFAQSFGDIKDHAEESLILTPDMPRKFSFTTDHTVYVLSKNFAVDLIENYHQMYGLKRFIFRLPTIYSYSPEMEYYVDGKKQKIGYRVLIEKAIAGEEIQVWGDPDRQKDMVYVKDFCQMLYKALFVDRNSGYYNVGTGVGTTLLEQVQGIVDVFGSKDKKSNIVFCPEERNAPQYIMDIENARKELSYEPQYDYISMLADYKKEMQQEKNNNE